jgi:hypothetical protein
MQGGEKRSIFVALSLLTLCSLNRMAVPIPFPVPCFLFFHFPFARFRV